MRAVVVLLCTVPSAACIRIPEFHGDAGIDGSDGAADVAIQNCNSAIMITGLLVYLPLDAVNGVITEDASPNNHDGTVLGGATLGPGHRGQGMILDGGSRAINLGSPAAFDNLDAMTVCAWVNPLRVDAQNPGATIADKSLDGYDGGWNAYLDYDQSDFALHPGYLSREGEWAYGTAFVPMMRWTHACTTWSLSTGLAIYADGALETISGTGTVHPPPAHDDAAHDLVLGRATNANQYHLNGTLDDFLLYSRVLSADEIAAIHACTP